RVSEREMISAPPPLALPPDRIALLDRFGRPAEPHESPTPHSSTAPTPRAAPRVVERLVPAPAPAPLDPKPLPRRQYAPPEPAVIERAIPAALPAAIASSERDDRVFAGRLRNPALTVPQGTMIAAVLETALDSTRPGAVRAIV